MERTLRIRRTKAVLRFFKEADKRETQGLAIYGDFDPGKDRRILCQEAIEECLDASKYMDFLIRKHPILKHKARGVQVYAHKTWCLLEELKCQEEALNLKKGV